MNIFVTIILTLVVFGVIIAIHELGHFLVAKAIGAKVNEFALGMGPALFKHTWGETMYSIRLFPIGGYNRIEGEDEESNDARAFGKKPVWGRILVTVAGAIMNLLLGFVLVLIITSAKPYFASTTIAAFDKAAVSNSQLMLGDRIVKINNSKVKVDYDILFSLMRDTDGKVDFTVERDGKIVELNGVPFNLTTNQDGSQSLRIDFKVLPLKKTVLTTVNQAFNMSVTIGKVVWISLIELITGHFDLQQIAGPVGVSQVIGQASAIGWDSLLTVAAFISINVGIFNLLPLPALDGGRLIFLIIELIRRKPIDPKYENAVHSAGFVLLMLLAIVIAIKDTVFLFK